MKLLTKTSRIYFLVSLVVYLTASFVFYRMVRSMIYREIEDRLLLEKHDFVRFVEKWGRWSDENFFVENKIQVVPLEAGNEWKGTAFKDTAMYESFAGVVMPFRQLTFGADIGGKPYVVSIRKSMLEPLSLIEAITGAMISFLGVLLLCMFFFHRRLSKTLWLPFNQSLARIKSFDWTRPEEKGGDVMFPAGEIQEFNELNEVLNRMIERIRRDYNSLKEFTGNASHEIQTPLALITARVEQMIQSENLSEEQLRWLQEIFYSSRKTSRLLEGLLLLSRIENKQFTDVSMENVTAFLETRLEDFSDILAHKGIHVVKNLEEPFHAVLSHALMEILVSNLLKNAVRHNLSGGVLFISSGPESLEIKNTGPELTAPSDTLFERFRKESGDKESLGLGLSIARQICDSYGLDITYTYESPFHKISVTRSAGEKAFA